MTERTQARQILPLTESVGFTALLRRFDALFAPAHHDQAMLTLTVMLKHES